MVKIRLRRMGNRNRPYYRIVVSDSRKTPFNAALEQLGHYDPLPTPPKLEIDNERVAFWVENGAQMSPVVKRLVKRYGTAA